jgi:hypothetical protein
VLAQAPVLLLAPPQVLLVRAPLLLPLLLLVVMLALHAGQGTHTWYKLSKTVDVMEQKVCCTARQNCKCS